MDWSSPWYRWKKLGILNYLKKEPILFNNFLTDNYKTPVSTLHTLTIAQMGNLNDKSLTKICSYLKRFYNINLFYNAKEI